MLKEYPRHESYAIQGYADTKLGKNFSALEKKHPDKSGYLLLPEGDQAFAARLSMMDLADKTIDIQYYIYRFDIAGKMLAKKLLDAADRGVRVRLLLDDMEIEGNDHNFAVLAAHQNIHVRFFNPFYGRSGFSRAWSFIFDFERINQRMHNKVFAVDNQMAIVGGRNIAQAYFTATPNQYFSDLDVLAVGPIVRAASASFDQFWNSELSVPVDVLVGYKASHEELAKLRSLLGRSWYEYENHDFGKRFKTSDFKERIENRTLSLIWAPGKVVYDKPEQITDKSKDRFTLVNSYFEPHLEYTGEEFLLISPYVIPGKHGMELFRTLRSRGVRFSILTNSLAATDIAVVYGAYADYRKSLLDLGIQVFELKPVGDAPFAASSDSSSVGATLHAKTLVFDRSEIFIGSLNLDPRSIHLNTELGFIITSPPLARQVVEMFEKMTSLDSSLRLSLEEERLVWTTMENDEEVRYYRSPYVSRWRIFWSNLGELIVPNGLL